MGTTGDRDASVPLQEQGCPDTRKVPGGEAERRGPALDTDTHLCLENRFCFTSSCSSPLLLLAAQLRTKWSQVPLSSLVLQVEPQGRVTSLSWPGTFPGLAGRLSLRKPGWWGRPVRCSSHQRVPGGQSAPALE